MRPSLKITLIGSSKTGKSTFNRRILSDDLPIAEIQSKFDSRRTIMTIMQEENQISINDTKGEQILDQQSPRAYLLTSSSIVIVFFDVSSNQSYWDVGKKWLPFIKAKQKGLKLNKIVLLANKIDLKNQMSLKSIEELAKNNNIRVYYCHENICYRVLLKIITDYYVQKQCDTISKSRQSKVQTSSGFFRFKEMFRRSASFNSQNIKSQIQKTNTEYSKIIGQINNHYHIRIQQKYKSLQKQIESMYKQIFGIPITQENQTIQLQQAMDKLQSRAKQCYKTNRQLKNKLIQKDLTLQQIKNNQQGAKNRLQNIMKQNQLLKQEIVKQSDEINQMKVKYQSIIRQKQQQFQKIARQNKRINQLLIQKDQQLKKYANNCVNKVQQHQQQQQQKIGTISEIQLMFYDSAILRKIQNRKSILNEIKQIIQVNCNKYMQMKMNEDSIVPTQNPLIEIDRAYHYDSYNSSSFHQYIDTKSHLLYLIKASQNGIILIYTPEVYGKGKYGTVGILIVYSNGQIKVYQFVEGTKIWRYDMLKLVFGNFQLVVETGRYCNLTVQNKNNCFVQSGDKSLSQILCIQETNVKIPLLHFQILKLTFREQ